MFKLSKVRKIRFGMEIDSLCPVSVQVLLSFLSYHKNLGHLIDLPASCHNKIQFIRLIAAKSNSSITYPMTHHIQEPPPLPVQVGIFPRTLPPPPGTANQMDSLEFPKHIPFFLSPYLGSHL